MEPRRTRARAARHLDPARAPAQPPDQCQDRRLGAKGANEAVAPGGAASPRVGETSAERLLPFLRRREAGQRLRGAACRLFQLLVRLLVIDIEAAGLGRVPGRLREHLDAVVLGVDRKSTRLNSSHVEISYAVFCLKKKKKKKKKYSYKHKI